MKRKILSFVLVAAMLVSMVVFAPSAGATESLATLELGDAVGAPGETVTVDFVVTTEALAGIQFMFEYDASRLTYAGTSWTTAYPNPVDPTQTGFAADLTNGDGKVFTAVGPYRVPSWATAQNVGAIDLSAGVTLATLNFTIKANAPAGDAYVKFAPLYEGAVQPNKISTGSAEIVATEMTFVDGKVTVLPKSYIDASVAAESDFKYDYWDAAAGDYADDAASATGISIYEYTGSDAIVIIPETIEGLPVQQIEMQTFDELDVEEIYLPAGLLTVCDGAIVNCANLLKVFVFGEDTEIESNAIGFEGSFRKGKWDDGPDLILNADGTAALTTIVGFAGSSAESYATAGDGAKAFPFVASTASALYSLTFDGATYMVFANTVAPGTAIVDGKTAIAWTDGTNTYAAGSAITLTGDVALTPVTINAPATATTVDFKLTENEADLAMRFTASLSLEDYAKLADLGTVSLGMLITPAKYVSKAGSFTKEALDDIDAKNGAYVDIAIDGYYDVTATDYIFAGSLKGFSAATLAKNPDFAAVLYATVTTEGGDVFTVYGDYDFGTIQNVKGVAESLTTSSDLTDTQKGWLTTLVGKFTA